MWPTSAVVAAARNRSENREPADFFIYSSRKEGFVLFGRSAVAEIEYRQKSGTAVRADNNAQRCDLDFADLRISRADRGTDGLGVVNAVGVKDMDIGAGTVNRSKVADNAVNNQLERVFPAADFFF